MLIVDMWDVVCEEAGATTKQKRFTSISAKAKIEAKVNALVFVDFYEDKKVLSLVKQNGEEETDSDKIEFLLQC